jgi:hypothetical protein
MTRPPLYVAAYHQSPEILDGPICASVCTVLRREA